MGNDITFESNNQEFCGYLATPGKPGPGVIVIQEWWGLVGHIKSVADRFAESGFVALAPDFYNGQSTSEPDEAGSLMMALNIANAAEVLKGATNFLLSSQDCLGEKAGVVGFCMGGQLSLFAAGIDPRIAACVNYYGIHPNVEPNYSAFQCEVTGFFAEFDDYANAESVKRLDKDLTQAGVHHSFTTYPGTHHAFFNSDRPEVYNYAAAEDSWNRMMEFFNRLLR